ncbi:hypothetical protein S7711_02123 [Stachybotrys chartarum IBT 7711]|uniref:DNA-directed RNA polymerase I subunit RPA34.5 n=1 Tax=Stachybotrys chartarum (strain CBS 109288 / IBT 7711) TaxID=1280523 RepID=A0A084ARI3_STACB|nr:hypothetical protein S7711_02123 [Stachybotrys chartarum IBT 7711]
MAPKEPFKVHSLSKHIADTEKGLSADAQFNRRPGARAAITKKNAGTLDANIFGANDDDDDDSSDGDSSDEEGGSDYLRKLQAANALSTAKRRSKPDEIADSDVDRQTPVTKATKKPPVKAEPDSSSTSSESESESSESEAEAQPKKSTAKANGVNRDKVSATSSSSSSGSDDDSDSDSSSEEPESPTSAQATKTTKAAPAADDSSESESDSDSDSTSASGSDSGSESDDESESKPAKKAQAKPATNGKSKVAASPSSSSSDESDSEDQPAPKTVQKAVGPKVASSDDEASDEEMVDESMHLSDREPAENQIIPSFLKPGFALRKGEDGVNGADVVQQLKKANAEGKQFWYFTVPPNVPISVIEKLEIPMDHQRSNENVFTHNGEQYGVSFDSLAPKSTIQILIPSAQGPQMQSLSRQPSQVMQVRRIAQVGNGTNGSTAVSTDKRAPRPQPKGLKARFQPIGVNSSMGKIGQDASSDAEADIEMMDAPAPSTTAVQTPAKKDKSKKPKETPAKTPAGKSKNKKATELSTPLPSIVPNQDATPATARKTKRKHTPSEDEAALASSQLVQESLSAELRTKKQKTNRNASPDLGSDHQPSSTVVKKQTPVVPPTIPHTSSSSSDQQPTSTPASKKTDLPATSSTKKSKKSKVMPPAPGSSQPAPTPGKVQTPVPVPRQTAVPLPSFPSSTPAPASSAPAPVSTPSLSKEEKKARKRKEKEAKNKTAIPSSQPSITESAKKVTPVPPPKLNGMV